MRAVAGARASVYAAARYGVIARLEMDDVMGPVSVARIVWSTAAMR